MTRERSWWQENTHDGKKRLRVARGGSGGQEEVQGDKKRVRGQEEIRGARRPHGGKRKAQR